MIVIAILFIGLGYSLIYWGANNVKQWGASTGDRTALEDGTQAVPFPVLVGVSKYTDTPTGKGTSSVTGTAGSFKHPVPFPYNKAAAMQAATGSAPAGNSTASPGTGSTVPNSPGGASISPNYPGLPGSTMPSAPIPGTNV